MANSPSNPRRVRVALVDDHALFREGVAALLARSREFEVAWDVASTQEALDRLAAQPADVIITDVSLPGSSGITATREFVRRSDARVLMLTMHSGHEFVIQALLAGATGYALKSQRFEETVEAIQVTAQGKLYLAPEISRTVLDEYHKRIRGVSNGVLDALSKREKEIFELVVQNRSNRDISRLLGISVKTVETHRMAINKKLNVHSSAELIRFAALHGLIHT